MPTRSEIMIDLVEKITVCEEESQVESLLESITKIDRPKIVSFVNAHAVNLSTKDDAFFRHLVDSDIVLQGDAAASRNNNGLARCGRRGPRAVRDVGKSQYVGSVRVGANLSDGRFDVKCLSSINMV